MQILNVSVAHPYLATSVPFYSFEFDDRPGFGKADYVEDVTEMLVKLEMFRTEKLVIEEKQGLTPSYATTRLFFDSHLVEPGMMRTMGIDLDDDQKGYEQWDITVYAFTFNGWKQELVSRSDECVVSIMRKQSDKLPHFMARIRIECYPTPVISAC